MDVLFAALVPLALLLLFSEKVWGWLYVVWDGLLERLWRS